MSMSTQFLTVPGLGSSGPSHWQTIWEQEHPELFTRVEQDNWLEPLVEDWVTQLHLSICQLSKPTIIIAHSLGCLTVAFWAKYYYAENIKAIVMVAPPDSEQVGFPDEIKGFTPIPLSKLPYKSIVIASTNDEYASIERAKFWAENWGSEFVNLGAFGHINANSNLADWKAGKEIVNQILDTNL